MNSRNSTCLSRDGQLPVSARLLGYHSCACLPAHWPLQCGMHPGRQAGLPAEDKTSSALCRRACPPKTKLVQLSAGGPARRRQNKFSSLQAGLSSYISFQSSINTLSLRERAGVRAFCISHGEFIGSIQINFLSTG